MQASLAKWVETDHWPSDYYDLLGLLRFDPDGQAAQKRIRSSLRELIPLQNHRNEVIAKRAMRLQMELGRADEVFSDARKLSAYNNQLARKLRDAYQSSAGTNWSASDLRTWLQSEQQVHPERVPAVMKVFMSPHLDTIELNLDETLEQPAEKSGLKIASSDAVAAEVQKLEQSHGIFDEAPAQDAATLARPDIVVNRKTPMGSGGEAKAAAAIGTVSALPAEPQANATPHVRNPDEVVRRKSSRRNQPNWKTVKICGLVVIGLLVLINVAFILGRIGGDDEQANEKEPPPASDRDTVDKQPKVDSPDSPLLPRTFPKPAIDNGAFAIGRTGEWVGELDLIWGRSTNPAELHFRVILDEPIEGRERIDAFVQHDDFARQVLDYRTTVELQDETGKSGDSVRGDRVRVTGVVSDAPQYTVTSGVGPCIRLQTIECVDLPGSEGVVGGAPRAISSYRVPPDQQRLRGILRLPPITGPDLKFQGVYRGFNAEDKTVFVSLSAIANRGVEVTFSGADFSTYQNGDVVEVIAAPTSYLYPRVIDGTRYKRPMLKGRTIRRPEVDGEVITNSVGASGAGPDSSSSSTDTAPPSKGSKVLNRKGRGDDVLVASEDGAAALLANGKWQLLDLKERVPQRIMWSLIDSRGNCWLSGEGGLLRLSATGSQTYTAADGLPKQPLAHVFEDAQQRIWVSSWGGGVSLIENGKWRTISAADGLRQPDVNGCAEDAQGRIWVVGGGEGRADSKGISLFVNGAFEPGGIGDQLPVNVMSVDGDSKGRVFLGCIGGLLIVDPNAKLKLLTPKDGLPQKTPQATFVDSQNRIWAGTWGGGVARIDSATRKVLDEDRLADAGHVRRIAEDRSGTIWVGALEGLWKRDGNRWQKVATPTQVQKVSMVATIPKFATQHLFAWKTAALPNVARPLPDKPNIDGRNASPRPAPRTTKAKPSKRSIDVILPGSRKPFRIYLGVDRNFLLGKLGVPKVTQPVDLPDGQHRMDMYARSEPGPVIHVLLIAYGPNDKTEFLDSKNIPATASDDQRLKEITTMLESYLGTLRGQ